jgi:hypothetical protein
MDMAYVLWVTVVIALILGGMQFMRNRAARKHEKGRTEKEADDNVPPSGVRETPQSGLVILRNIALYLLVPLGILLLIKFMVE